MTQETQDIDIVVGGGIAGLVAALLLAERDGRKVMVVERESVPGGLLRCFDYGEHGRFDYGMHNMYETGIPALDEILFGLLPEDHWQLLEGMQRDLAGLFFAGRLQLNSPFPDIRNLSRSDWQSCTASFFDELDRPSSSAGSNANAYDDAKSRLGKAVADMVIDAALRKQFGKPACELAAFASRLTTLSRVVMFGEDSFVDLMRSNQLRERLAFPEQRNLPTEWASGRKAYYPKAYGIYRVIDALLERLAAADVEILTNAALNALSVDTGKIRQVTVAASGSTRTIDHIGRVVWTSGLPPVAGLLGLDLSSIPFDKPRKTVVVNLLLRNPPVMGDLYYFYCYEPGFRTFRVTHFGAYCEGASRSGGHPVAVELLIDEPLPDAPALQEIAIQELLNFGVIATPEDVNFVAAEVLAAGFPMPSCRNFDALNRIRENIHDMKIENLVLLGVLSEENVFFQRDVLAQTYTKLSPAEH